MTEKDTRCSPILHMCAFTILFLSHTHINCFQSQNILWYCTSQQPQYTIFLALSLEFSPFHINKILSSFVGEFVLFFVVYLFGGFIWYFSHFSLLWLNFQHYFALCTQVLLEYKHCDIVVDDLITKTVSRKLASRQGSHYEYIRPMMIYVYGMTKQEDLGFNPSTQNIMKSRSHELFISDIFQSTLVDLCN